MTYIVYSFRNNVTDAFLNKGGRTLVDTLKLISFLESEESKTFKKKRGDKLSLHHGAHCGSLNTTVNTSMAYQRSTRVIIDIELMLNGVASFQQP